jgi:hypothetical protein
MTQADMLLLSLTVCTTGINGVASQAMRRLQYPSMTQIRHGRIGSMRRLYAIIVYTYARLVHPEYQHSAILYLRQEENGMISWLFMERARDHDLVFHPVQRWLKNILDDNAALQKENQELKEQLTKPQELKK